MKNLPENHDLRERPDEEMDVLDAIGSGNVADEVVAEEVVVHGLLRDRALRDAQRDEQRIREVMNEIESIEQNSLRDSAVLAQPSTLQSCALQSKESSQVTNIVHHKSRRVAFASLAAALAAVFLLMFTFARHDQASAAMVSLEKMIEVAKRRVDRSYRVFVVEEYDANKVPRNAQPINRRRHQDQIGGAVIHARGPNEFVFVRRMSDGRQRVSGCDGRESWAFREDGPVHVSSDLSRYRSGLPGREQDLPFINLHAHLQQLQVGYDIQLSGETIESSDGRKLSQLNATRKSFDVRGPMSVAVWFDTETGVIYQMLLDKLPRRGGGPKSVRLELLNPEDLGQTDFGPDFFSHDSHHEPLREVRYEDAR